MIIKTKLSNKDIDIEKTHQITDFGETHILRGCYVPYSLTDYCFDIHCNLNKNQTLMV